MAKRVSSGQEGGGGLMGNMLRRGESRWLCMKFEVAFFAGHGLLIGVFPPSCLALTAHSLCDFMLFAAHFSYEDFMLFSS
jgi:hypothetical protein